MLAFLVLLYYCILLLFHLRLHPPPQHVVWKNSRPKNSASVVRVPFSDSNRSRSGVKAIILRTAWKKLRWMNGNVLIRYTMLGRHRVSRRSRARDILPCAASGYKVRFPIRSANFGRISPRKATRTGEERGRPTGCDPNLVRYQCAPCP